MKSKSSQLVLATVLLVFASGVHAAATYSCSLGTPTGYTQTYSETGNSSSGLSVIVTCVKSGNGGAKTVSGTVTLTYGNYPSPATQNRAFYAPNNYINYGIYSSTGICTTKWSSGPFSATFAGGGGATIPTTLSYYGCVPSTQTVLLAAPGTYTDTVTATLAITSGNATITGTNPQSLPVSILVPASCSISSAPGTITFNYTSFGLAANSNTSFTLTCNNTLNYTLSLDANSGTLLGLSYSLLLSTLNSGGSNTLGSVSSGIAQTFYINGAIAAGQSGTCATMPSCTATAAHSLYITY